ncbi:MAG TPA: ATP-dependent helicase HrpB [Cytophagales bacterium]|nr:ATP-dependent helicase HrpB [Cytophagales bacterium]
MSEQLPILEILPELKEKLKENNIVILQAPPGAGKSTVLPLELLGESWLKGNKILLLQPRRLAAITVANRLSSLINEPVGKKVGYRIRFENRISQETKIEVVTEGILTRILQQDNGLEGVGLVIFDEFHERSLHADLAFVLCREVQQILREDLKILIMSATLNEDALLASLGDVPVLTSRGRQFPIEYKYIGQDKQIPLHKQVAGVVRKAMSEQDGDVLVFLPGIGEIQKTTDLLEGSGAAVYGLYGDLPQQKQQEAIMPHPKGMRKVVLATSIAETSITIQGIKIVVDSGYARMPRFDPRSGLSRLETVKVTMDSANQRAGRAGRLGPGICYRLWTEGSHSHLLPARSPEILEADLSSLVLELSLWGVKNIKELKWITPPPSGAVSQAIELLQNLGALDEDRITDRGREMLRLPTHPRIAHLLIEGRDAGLLSLATDIAAALEERDPLPRDTGVNLAERIEVLRKWRSKTYVIADSTVLLRIERLASMWRKALNGAVDNTFPNYEQVGKLLSAAYPERIARQREKHSNRYRLANGRVVQLTEHDPLIGEEWLSIAHLDAGKNEGRIFLAAPLNVKDVLHLAYEKEVVSWDSQKGVLIARNERRLGEITLNSTPLINIPEDQQAKILCNVLRSEGLNLLNWTETALSLQFRLANVKSWRPEENWPDLSNENLLNSLEEWIAPYLITVRKREDFGKLDLDNILKGMVPWEKYQWLEELAPEKLKVPSGSMIKMEYFSDGRPPVLAVRLQEVFGLTDTPTINEGRTKVLLHLLSPGYKPVQVTQDLRSFWKNTYPEVRKELRVRYQKHSWPEDPWNAEAVRGVKKKPVK